MGREGSEGECLEREACEEIILCFSLTEETLKFAEPSVGHWLSIGEAVTLSLITPKLRILRGLILYHISRR